MRTLSVALASAIMLGAAGACSVFGAADSENANPPVDPGPDAAGPDVAGQDAADATPAPGTKTIVSPLERGAAVAVAVDDASIYWWSTGDHRIAKVNKANPSVVSTVVMRPAQTVTAMAVGPTGLHWLEGGPDDAAEAGASNRIMRLVPGRVPVTRFRATSTLKYLALDVNRATTTEPGAIDEVTTTGVPFGVGLGIDQAALATDGTDVFYTYNGSVVRYDAAHKTGVVANGINGPSSLVADSSSLYAAIPETNGNTIVRFAKTNGSPSLVTKTKAGKLYLAIDNRGLIWGNVAEGTIELLPGTGGSPATVVSGIDRLNAIAADVDGIYWSSDSGSVGWLKR